MTTYNVYLRTYAHTVVTVEADNEDDALEAAITGDLPTICAHCTGYGSSHNLELCDEWEPAVGADEPDSAAVQPTD